MKENKNYVVISIVVITLLIGIFYGYRQFFIVPESFPVGKNFTINENETLKSISKRLEEGGYIHSPLLFRAGISFLGKDRAIQLGGYVFDKPGSLLDVVEVFVHGRPQSPLLSVTIPEGSTSFETAGIIVKALPSLSVDIFIKLFSRYNAEGKLFPSTYFLLPSYTEEDVVKLMLTTFSKKTAPLAIEEQIVPPLKSKEEVVVLASILEGEAKTEEDMKIVAGILLARMKINMPLQVDVAKETYKQKGLPSLPISNPGLTAINAVLHPATSSYLYYITGNDGRMYYAKTFTEHKKNIQKYLK